MIKKEISSKGFLISAAFHRQTYTHLNLNRIHSSGLVEHKLLKHPNLTRDPFLTSILYHSHLSHFLKVNEIVEFHEIPHKLIN